MTKKKERCRRHPRIRPHPRRRGKHCVCGICFAGRRFPANSHNMPAPETKNCTNIDRTPHIHRPPLPFVRERAGPGGREGLPVPRAGRVPAGRQWWFLLFFFLFLLVHKQLQGMSRSLETQQERGVCKRNTNLSLTRQRGRVVNPFRKKSNNIFVLLFPGSTLLLWVVACIAVSCSA